MSTTYSIACLETKKKLWIGQYDYIYTTSIPTMALLTRFLYEHAGKTLVFNANEYIDGYTNYGSTAELGLSRSEENYDLGANRSVLDGSFTASDLRKIADAMDKLKLGKE